MHKDDCDICPSLGFVPESDRVPIQLRRTTFVVYNMTRSRAFYEDGLGMVPIYGKIISKFEILGEFFKIKLSRRQTMLKQLKNRKNGDTWCFSVQIMKKSEFSDFYPTSNQMPVQRVSDMPLHPVNQSTNGPSVRSSRRRESPRSNRVHRAQIFIQCP